MQLLKETICTNEQIRNSTAAISRRFSACTQSTGRVGKSTVAKGLITWMHYAGIDFAAVDADSQHQTLSRRYPKDSAILDATKTFNDFPREVCVCCLHRPPPIGRAHV